MARTVLTRTLAGFGAVAASLLILIQLALAADLFGFEIAPLLSMFGWRGLLFLLALNAGLALFAFLSAGTMIGHRRQVGKVSAAILLLSCVALLWLLEWVFVEKPLTTRVIARSSQAQPTDSPGFGDSDFARFSLTRDAISPQAKHSLRVAYDRILINNTDVFQRHPLGATIDHYAAKYAIDAALLFTIGYLDSFYGEATSGPVPFLRNMTSETIRDVTQIHVPGWYVESSTRQKLISLDLLNKVAGDQLGIKLRYALQKANLDVSAQPYSSSTYSVTFLVMQLYPSEFADILDGSNTSALAAALRDAFIQLRETALILPCESTAGVPPYTDAYYSSSRTALKQFARAAYYLSVSDFDFATRVQSLILRHRSEYYEASLGSETWRGLPGWQRNAMLTMVQDIYKPNIGRLAYNLYTVPELTCAALAFVADSAQADVANLTASVDRLWRPREYEALWGGAGYQMAVLNEIGTLIGRPVPGVPEADTLDYAREIVSLNGSRR